MRHLKFLALIGALTVGCGSNDDGETNDDAGTDSDAGPDAASGESCDATLEICDGADNDCDDAIDEGCARECLEGDTRECGRLVGVCAEQLGTQFCNELTGRWDTTCEGSLQEGELAESCNGADDDCDGATDETCGCDVGFYDLDGDGLCEYACFETKGGVESCDGDDNDCDGAIDEDSNLATDEGNCGSCGTVCEAAHGTPACVAGSCTVTSCDVGFYDLDADPATGCEYLCPRTVPIFETCNGEDDDCDGVVDNGATSPFYYDGDADGAGNPTAFITGCSPLPGYVGNNVDCNDANPSVRPGFVDFCDTVDNDCDGETDEDVDFTSDPWNCGGCGTVCSFANAGASCIDGTCVMGSCAPNFWNADAMDADGCEYGPCLLTNGGIEQCDGIDNDCDIVVDEGVTPTWYFDADGDGHGGASLTTEACAAPPDFVAERDDCNDLAETVYPGAAESCNGADDNCNDLTDEGFDLSTDEANCGSCGAVCRYENGSAVCLDGGCVFAGCAVGYYDLDGEPGNGCEYLCPRTSPVAETCNNEDDDCDGAIDEDYDLLADASNCGFCGRICDIANAGSSCTDGDCVFAGCDTGFVNQNGSEADGCEYACTATGSEACDAGMTDEDCDGSRNEGCSCADESVQFCGSDTGECEYGSQTCTNGVWGSCAGGTGPAAETCDGDDNDCDGAVDEDFDLATDAGNCGSCGFACEFLNAAALCDAGECTMGTCDPGFADLDGSSGNGCEYGPCVPTNGGIEQCDAIDNDCSGTPDEGCFCTDGERRDCGPASDEGACTFGTETCSDGAWGTCLGAVFPDPEVCDGADNDCDGFVDDSVLTTFYRDADGDGYGDPADSAGACDPPAGYVANALDCDDTNAGANPAESEVCGNTVDEDCSGEANACAPEPEPDADGDGDADASDCDDEDADVFTGAPEVCNGVDDNCDGETDEGALNPCGGCASLPGAPGGPCDGPDEDRCDEGTYSCSGSDSLTCSDTTGTLVEICRNGADENCDGAADEFCPSVASVTLTCTDTGSDLTIVAAGALSVSTIGAVPAGETITTVELGADLDGCWDAAVSCFPVAYAGDGPDHTFAGVPYTGFTPRLRTDADTVRYLDLRATDASGSCAIITDGAGGLKVAGTP